MEHFDTKIGRFHKALVKIWEGVLGSIFSSKFQLRPKTDLSANPHPHPFVIVKGQFAQMPPKRETLTQKRKLAKDAAKPDTTSKRPKNNPGSSTPSKPAQNASQSSRVRALINFNGPLPEIPYEDLVNPEAWKFFTQVYVIL